MTDFKALLLTLSRHNVDFIVVGGAAAIAHGSARLAEDLDIVYDRSPENLVRLVMALAGIKPFYRDAPRRMPFRLSVVWRFLRWRVTHDRELNYGLQTSLGAIDLLGEIPGGGDYLGLKTNAIPLEVFETRCLCLSLTQLIRAKRAAGRPKDLEALAELEAIAEENDQ